MKLLKLLIIIFFLNINFSYSNDKIAFINLDFVIQNSKIGKSVLAEIENLNNQNIRELQLKESELKKIEEDIKNKQNILSQDEFQKEVNLLKEKIKKFRNTKDQLVRNFEKEREKGLNDFFLKINPVIQNYMDQNSIEILLERKNVFIGKNDSDITKDIINEINEKIK